MRKRIRLDLDITWICDPLELFTTTNFSLFPTTIPQSWISPKCDQSPSLSWGFLMVNSHVIISLLGTVGTSPKKNIPYDTRKSSFTIQLLGIPQLWTPPAMEWEILKTGKSSENPWENAL